LPATIKKSEVDQYGPERVRGQTMVYGRVTF
jgi:hypothetical protein